MPPSNHTRMLAAGVIENIYFMSGAIPRPRWRVLFVMELLGWCAIMLFVVSVLTLIIKALA